MSERFRSFSSFYPFYLGEHSNRMSRRLHFIGSWLVLLMLLMAFITRSYAWLVFVPVFGYGFAWVGHFFFEKNRPATFRHPIWSLMGDWVMFKDILMGKVKLW